MITKKIPIILFILFFLCLLCCNDSPREGYKYVGSVNSNKYHKPSCRWAKKIKPQNEVWFRDEEDAKRHRYVPCKVCKP